MALEIVIAAVAVSVPVLLAVEALVVMGAAWWRARRARRVRERVRARQAGEGPAVKRAA